MLIHSRYSLIDQYAFILGKKCERGEFRMNGDGGERTFDRTCEFTFRRLDPSYFIHSEIVILRIACLEKNPMNGIPLARSDSYQT